jgi:hypothetical protein
MHTHSPFKEKLPVRGWCIIVLLDQLDLLIATVRNPYIHLDDGWLALVDGLETDVTVPGERADARLLHPGLHSLLDIVGQIPDLPDFTKICHYLHLSDLAYFLLSVTL